MTAGSDFIAKENKKLANSLRRMADWLERSDRAHCWHARVAGSEPYAVSMQTLDREGHSLASGPIRSAVIVGDGEFVERMKAHLDAEI